jgi:hypothetical protein
MRRIQPSELKNCCLPKTIGATVTCANRSRPQRLPLTARRDADRSMLNDRIKIEQVWTSQACTSYLTSLDCLTLLGKRWLCPHNH